MVRILATAGCFATCLILHTQSPKPSPDVARYITVDAPRVVLTHVRVIDGLGNPPLEDRNVVIEGGKIASISAGADVAPAPNTRVLDLKGATVLPGLVGMHNHLFHIARTNLRADGSSEGPVLVPQMTFSAPRLYLAAGVTTIRTTGSVEPYADLNLKRLVDAGKVPGPHIHVTAPYLEGAGSPFLQMHALKGPEDAKAFVNFWADAGATSFKAYMHITRAELKAAIDAAHARGLKVTGHLSSVTYDEAADLGIDNLEHGFLVNTQLDPGKEPDKPSTAPMGATPLAMDPEGPAAKALFAKLVSKKIAVTSTLPVFEHMVPNRPPLRPLALDVMSPQAREAFLYARNRTAARPAEAPAALFKRAMALERAFVAAGGLLIAGCDPTGNGGTLPGLSDWRQVQLLVEAGFTPVEALRVATHNGARFLGLEHRIGSVAPGLDADLVVVRGNPAVTIQDLEKVELVFKGGLGYDSEKLFASVKGRYGQY